MTGAPVAPCESAPDAAAAETGDHKMSERYTRKDAYKAFTRLASALGKTWSDEHGKLWSGPYWAPAPAGQLWNRNVNSALTATVGAWALDYNGIYGGFVVEEMYNGAGGVSRPMGDMRRNAREFCDAVRFAMDALKIREAEVATC